MPTVVHSMTRPPALFAAPYGRPRRDNVLEPHDLTHGRIDGSRRRIIYALSRPPKTGDCASVAIFTPDGRTSMP